MSPRKAYARQTSPCGTTIEKQVFVVDSITVVVVETATDMLQRKNAYNAAEESCSKVGCFYEFKMLCAVTNIMLIV
ncbi:unnamed protein product [Larinioides sclopetarius]|uniref:Uncharacterized protein n=1 Tax=Larinioides sclopetarius TaxID=280406 RepID=A0AAV2BRH1_9ARAC